MSEYDGPAYKRKSNKPVNQRRFNFQSNRGESKRVFIPGTSREQVNNNDPVHYELPKRIKDLEIKDELSAPVDRQHLTSRIESIQLTQDAAKKEKYQVPFLNRNESDSSTKEFVQPTEPLLENSLETNHTKETQYQPAFQPEVMQVKPKVETVDSTKNIVEEKSIEEGLIREVALRLSKTKDTYVLFEKR